MNSLSKRKEPSRHIKPPQKVYIKNTDHRQLIEYWKINTLPYSKTTLFNFFSKTMNVLMPHFSSPSSGCHKNRHRNNNKELKIYMCNYSVCQWILALKRPTKQLTHKWCSLCMLLRTLRIVIVKSVWSQFLTTTTKL